MTDPAKATRITQVGTVFVPVSDQEREAGLTRPPTATSPPDGRPGRR